MKYGLLIFVIVLLGCANDNLTTQVTLEGKWVEINTNTDTLTFGLLGGQEAVILSRDKEMRDGFLLPKSGSGSYDYKLLTDQISLRWHLSSNSAFTDYYIKQTGNRMEIENFYSTTAIGTIQTFEKLK